MKIQDVLVLFQKVKITLKSAHMELMPSNFLVQHSQVFSYAILKTYETGVKISINLISKTKWMKIMFHLLVPRHGNKRSWLYRIYPSACHLPFEPYTSNKNFPVNLNEQRSNPNQVSILRCNEFGQTFVYWIQIYLDSIMKDQYSFYSTNVAALEAIWYP